MAQVFVSYSRHDEARTRPILDALARSGFRVSHAQDLPPGMSFADAIGEEIAPRGLRRDRLVEGRFPVGMGPA
ncbi:MAG: toll/interleukin-1 receptor domain-containing protein [Methyloceanibacter sp.]